MELTTVAQFRNAFYRLLDIEVGDEGLTSNDEAETEVVDTFLTRGSRAAQRYMLKMGYKGWRARSPALSFSGTDSADGGRYTDLPDDFLRAVGNDRRSALREANGNDWGKQIDELESNMRGNFYYFRGEQLWLTRTAIPPTTLYLEYHFKHPLWDDDVEIDFPVDARYLIVAEAGNVAKEESWLVGGPELETKIERALVRARQEAMDIARPSKRPRQMAKPRRYGSHW